jgi:hypothetical protein
MRITNPPRITIRRASQYAAGHHSAALDRLTLITALTNTCLGLMLRHSLAPVGLYRMAQPLKSRTAKFYMRKQVDVQHRIRVGYKSACVKRRPC